MMTPERSQREYDIFQEARQRDPAERAALLDRLCAGDPGLRSDVERLLADDERASQFLIPPGVPLFPEYAGKVEAAFEPAPADSRDADSALDEISRLIADGPGTRIGPYVLLRKIADGGMGVVYEAERTQHVRHKVALKIIRPGTDTEQVIARFEAERQALAMMDHPNIARVYDGGTTEVGQPFFVMELVSGGEPITAYCDRKRLSVRARLELFVAVCRAVQHAHQKMIIHRDLKPGNVLVTEVDGRPTPKVIDFGVAKAIEFKLTDLSLDDDGVIVGTPAYMSPEQADPSSMHIDARTDIYSLGVILYELLAGSPPLDAKQFKRGATLEMLRRLRTAWDVDPPKPSTRLSGSGEALAMIAACRNVKPARLSRLVRGELDWIAMKALEKQRKQRYQTPNDLARDIQCYLDGDPLPVAGPPSRAYRMRKFVRKHRVALAIAGIFASIALVMAVQELQRQKAEIAVINLQKAEAEARVNLQKAEAEHQRTNNEKLQLQLEKQDEKLKAHSLGLAQMSMQGGVARKLGIDLLKEDIKGLDERIKLAGEDAPRLKKVLLEYRRNLRLTYIINNMLKEAAGNLEETKRLIEGWCKESDAVRPGDALYDAARLDVSWGLGWVREQLGQKEEALLAYQEGASLSERIDGRGLPDELVASRARLHMRFGLFLEEREKSGKRGETRESRDQFEIGRKILEPSVQDHRASKSYWEELGPLMATIYGKLGDSNFEDGRPEPAIEDYNREIKLWTRLDEMTPAVVDKEYIGPVSSLIAGGTRESSGERSDRSRESATKDLGLSLIWFRLARAHQSRSAAAVALGRFDEARVDLKFSRKKFEALLKADPNNFFAKHHQALVERDFGLLSAKAGDLPAATASLGEAARLLRALPNAPTSLAAMAVYAGLGPGDQQNPLGELADIQRQMIEILDRSSRRAAAAAAVRTWAWWGAAHPGVLDAGLSVVAMIPPLRIALPGGIDGGTLADWLGRQGEKEEETLVRHPSFVDAGRLPREAVRARIERAGTLRALNSGETEDAFRDAIVHLEQLAVDESVAMSPRPADSQDGPPDDDAAGGVPPVAILPWLADTHGDLADWYADHRRFDPAVHAGRLALETWDRILRRYPYDLSARVGRANSHRRLGRILRAAGRADEAVTSFGEALHVWKSLAKDSPLNAGIAGGIVLDLSNLGSALLDCGYYSEAKSRLDVELSRAQWLARQEPEKSAHRRSEAGAWWDLAEWYHLMGHRDEAQSAYDRATRALEQLAREGVLGDQAQRDMAQWFQGWGWATLGQGDPEGAREIFGRLIDQLEPFAEASGMASDRLSLSNAYGQLGLAWILDKDYAGYEIRLMFSANNVSDITVAGEGLIVVAVVDQVLHIRITNGAGKTVVDTDEKRLTEQTRPIEDLRKLLESFRPPHELTESEKVRVNTSVSSIVGHIYYAEGVAAFSHAVQEVQGILDRNDSPMPTDTGAILARLKNLVEAARLASNGGLDNLGPGPSQPVGVARNLHTWRLFSLIAQGDLARAVQTAETLQGLAPDDPETLVLAAQGLARCASAVGGGTAPEDLNDADRSTRAGYVERAVTVLEQAVLRGYGRANPAVLTRDYNFIILREHPRYQSLLELLSTQGYLTVEKPTDDADRSRKASALGSMAWWHHLMGRQAESRSLYGKSIEILKQRVAERSGDTRAIRDLANGWAESGWSAYEEGDSQAACAALSKGVKLLEPLAAAPNAADARRDLANMYEGLGASCIDARDFARAVESLQQGRKLLQETAGPGNTPAPELARMNDLLAAAQAMSGGRDDIKSALAQPLPVAKQLLKRRARACIARGDPEDAARAIEALRGLAPGDSQNLHTAACLFARCASAVGRGIAPGRQSEADRSRRARYVERAVAILEEAVAHGLRRDGPSDPTRNYDLIVIRSHPRYAKLLGQVLRGRDRGSQTGQ